MIAGRVQAVLLTADTRYLMQSGSAAAINSNFPRLSWRPVSIAVIFSYNWFTDTSCEKNSESDISPYRKIGKLVIS